jgi:hypothetical protein
LGVYWCPSCLECCVRYCSRNGLSTMYCRVRWVCCQWRCRWCGNGVWCVIRSRNGLSTMYCRVRWVCCLWCCMWCGNGDVCVICNRNGLSTMYCRVRWVCCLWCASGVVLV